MRDIRKYCDLHSRKYVSIAIKKLFIQENSNHSSFATFPSRPHQYVPLNILKKTATIAIIICAHIGFSVNVEMPTPKRLCAVDLVHTINLVDVAESELVRLSFALLENASSW